MEPTSMPDEAEHASYIESPFLKTLVASTSDAVLLINAEGSVMYHRPEPSEKDNEELVGTHYYDSVDESSMGELAAFIQKVISTPGLSQQGSFKVIDKAGRAVWIEGILTNLLHDPNIRALVATYRNVTEKKEMELALAQSEAKLRTIIESTADAIVYIDTDYTINSFNQKASEVVANKLGGILTIGQNCLSYSKPDRREKLGAALKAVFAGKELQFEQYYNKADGSYIWYYVRMLRAMGKNGELLGATITATDITKRKMAEIALTRSEANLRTIYEAASDGIVLIDNSYKIISLNPKAAEIARKDLKKEAKVGTSTLDYFGPERRAFIKSAIDKVIHGSNISYEVSYLQPDGSNTWYFVRLVPVQDPATGNTLSLTMTLTDITARKEHEHSIQAMNEQLESKVQERTASLQRLNKELEAFTYSVSHDLKSPAHIVNNLAHVLNEKYADALTGQPKELVDEIVKYSGHMELIIKDLLLLSNSTSTEIFKQDCNMQEHINAAIQENIDACISPNAMIEVGEIIDSFCDARLIKLVWVNLISNAMKYSAKSEGVIIEIGSYKEADKVIYYIKDNGIGFDNTYSSKIFQVFQRLHNIDQYEGTGVGLAIVQRIIHRHCGHIWAEGKPSEGATFYFSLPVVDKCPN